LVPIQESLLNGRPIERMAAIEPSQSPQVCNRNQLFDLGVRIQSKGGRFASAMLDKIALKRRVQRVQALVNVCWKQKKPSVFEMKSVTLFVDATLPKQEDLSSSEQRIHRNRPLL
jgi:hypothetical protein